jgi:hypothetical protein
LVVFHIGSCTFAPGPTLNPEPPTSTSCIAGSSHCTRLICWDRVLEPFYVG